LGHGARCSSHRICFVQWFWDAYFCEQQIHSTSHLPSSLPLPYVIARQHNAYMSKRIDHFRLAEAFLDSTSATSLSKWRIARQVKGSNFQKELRRSNPRSKPPLMKASRHPGPSSPTNEQHLPRRCAMVCSACQQILW